jgi:hypothetical protein
MMSDIFLRYDCFVEIERRKSVRDRPLLPKWVHRVFSVVLLASMFGTNGTLVTLIVVMLARRYQYATFVVLVTLLAVIVAQIKKFHRRIRRTVDRRLDWELFLAEDKE